MRAASRATVHPAKHALSPRCRSNLPRPPLVQARCAPKYDHTAPGTTQLLPIFEVAPNSHLATAEAAADRAFALLQVWQPVARVGGHGCVLWVGRVAGRCMRSSCPWARGEAGQ